jgi:hypothetical protein
MTSKEQQTRLDTLAVEITATDLKTHAWRLPKAKDEKMAALRAERNVRLKANDEELAQDDESWEGLGVTLKLGVPLAIGDESWQGLRISIAQDQDPWPLGKPIFSSITQGIVRALRQR